MYVTWLSENPVINEFLKSGEDIPTNILADRLQRLESVGLIKRKPYQEKPVRYTYTLIKKVKALGHSLLKWANGAR